MIPIKIAYTNVAYNTIHLFSMFDYISKMTDQLFTKLRGLRTHNICSSEMLHVIVYESGKGLDCLFTKLNESQNMTIFQPFNYVLIMTETASFDHSTSCSWIVVSRAGKRSFME